MMSLKCPWPSFSNRRVAAADGGDEEILVAVVVDVGEGGGDADPVGQADAGLGRDVAGTCRPPRFFQSSLPPTWLTK